LAQTLPITLQAQPLATLPLAMPLTFPPTTAQIKAFTKTFYFSRAQVAQEQRLPQPRKQG
jgi:hypothetical protein